MDLAKFISKCDSLQNRLEQFDEWRKVQLGPYDDHTLFMQYIKAKYTDFALKRIRHNAAIGLNDWQIKQLESNSIYIVERKDKELNE